MLRAMKRPYSYKPLEESLWEQLALWWSRTGIKPDTEPGSVLRTLFEAVGFEVEDLSFRFDTALDTAIPLAIFEAFAFMPLPAQKAAVPLMFERAAAYSTPLVIPAGFRVGRVDGVDYETTVDAEIPSGSSTALLSALCVTAGAVGNAPANTITFPRASLPTLVRVYNPQPATGGQDHEPLEEQKVRFARYIAKVHRATLAALGAAAMDVATLQGERAREVLVLDKVYKDSLAPGYIEVWVDDGNATASVALIDAIHAHIETYPYRAAGAIHATYAVTGVVTPISFELDGDPDDLEPCKNAARTYIKGLRIGQKVSRENLITVLTNTAIRSREITLVTPAADVPVGQTERAVLGTLTGTVT
jgi:hypothetical protein